MISNNKISHLINSQVPFFVRNDHQGFVTFLEKYYEYLEQEEKVVNRIKNVQTYFDIDLTIDEYANKLYSIFMNFLPDFALADRDILIKNIKDFYRAKGTEKATRFLFRILYNEEIDFYYPKRDILRASDGKWFIQRSLRVTDTKINSTANTSIFALEKFISTQIFGNTSLATAIVERVDRYFEQGQQIDELILSNIKGEFDNGETIFTLYTDATGTSSLTSNVFGGVISSLTITNAGSNYTVGDPVIFVSNTGTGACATVTSVTTGNVADITVLYGGAGFQNNDLLLISGGGGTGANANVSSVLADGSIHPNSYNIVASTISLEANTPINNTQYSNLVSSIVDPANNWISNSMTFWTYANTGPARTVLILNAGLNYTSKPTISILSNTVVFGLGILGAMEIVNGGQNYQVGDVIEFNNVLGGYGTGAVANVTNVDSSKSNAISQVKFQQMTGHFVGGSGYDENFLPKANVITTTGNGANIVVKAILGSGANLSSLTSSIGSIQTITITNRGSGYLPNTTIDLTGSGDGKAQANVFIVQGAYSYPGRYLNDDGHISSYNFLEDRDYYQIFSYVVKSTKSIADYRKAIKDINHPAGLKIFGEYDYVNENIGSEVSADEDANSIYNVENVGYVNTTSYITVDKTYVKTGNLINVSYISHGLNTNANVYLEFTSGGFANVQNSIYMIANSFANYFHVTQKSNVINIAINNAGKLYNANSYLIITGDGKDANASFTTNANGSIVSVSITEPGIGYTYVPTVTANGSNSIAATFIATISYANNTSGNVYVTTIRS